MVRSAAQQALARGVGVTSAPPLQPPGLTPRNTQPQPRNVVARQSRSPYDQPPRQVPVQEVHQPARAFGSSAMLDEAVLDIPAYLRRSKS
jgi:hypothetical protein